MLDSIQELEEYFAQHYTEQDISFGATFTHSTKDYFLPFPPLETAMQKYFYSGRYKELSDPELEILWQKAKRKFFTQRRAGILLGFLVLFIALLSWLVPQ